MNGMRASAFGQVFGRTRSTIARAGSRVKGRRMRSSAGCPPPSPWRTLGSALLRSAGAQIAALRAPRARATAASAAYGDGGGHTADDRGRPLSILEGDLAHADPELAQPGLEFAAP